MCQSNVSSCIVLLAVLIIIQILASIATPGQHLVSATKSLLWVTQT
jgi:hypothetical protein